VYAAGLDGLHVSTDAGSTWRRLRIEGEFGSATGATKRALGIDPAEPSVLYVGGDGGAWASSDGGGTWRQVRSQFTIALALDPSRRGVVYAGGDHWRIAKSTDGGETWQLAGAGLYTGSVARLWALTVSPARPSVVYAGGGSLPWQSHGRLYKSTDGARSWKRLAAFPATGAVMAVAVDPRRPRIVYVGTNRDLLRSADGGRTWRSTGLGSGALVYVGALAFDPVRPEVVYAGTRFGVRVSVDRGRIWKAAKIDAAEFKPYYPDRAFITALAVDPDGGRLYAATQAGNVIAARLPLATR
jgi:photosystem II stability/assembly factor-like uncharacterized protein